MGKLLKDVKTIDYLYEVAQTIAKIFNLEHRDEVLTSFNQSINLENESKKEELNKL